MIESLKIFWSAMTTNQKRAIAGISILIIVAISIGWINSFRAWNEIRIEKGLRKQAQKDADQALKNAAKIASELKKEREELNALEEKKQVKKDEVEQSKTETEDARDDYDRAVRESRTDNPGPDELCAELAELGYPCQ